MTHMIMQISWNESYFSLKIWSTVTQAFVSGIRFVATLPRKKMFFLEHSTNDQKQLKNMPDDNLIGKLILKTFHFENSH